MKLYGGDGKKYPLFSEIKGYPFYSYQSSALAFLLVIPGPFLFFLANGLIFNEGILAIGLTLSFIIPGIGLFLRSNVFNDSSCYLGDDIVLGYPTGIYWTTSLFIGLYGYFTGFIRSGGML
ncbi:hypothetical protein [Methanobrevibacter woesei]|uniref:hypothetical protein n=1 Tax=Methanobrevibacter woesei TaxID=190976 RepID=UPI0023F19C0A|nr:hypothetical protein [Methanobrevibacter woesei]